MPSEPNPTIRKRPQWMNLPNLITILRLILSIILFVTMAFDCYMASFVLFVVAAGTDWFDGYFARKYNLVTALGRILDPFADKVIICGTFTFLAANPIISKVPWGLRAWMVVVIVGRELLVTALRSFIEERGGDFFGKMVRQDQDGAPMHRRRLLPLLSRLSRPAPKRPELVCTWFWSSRFGRQSSPPSIPDWSTSPPQSIP